MEYKTLEEQVQELWFETPVDYVIDFFDSIWLTIRFNWIVGVVLTVSLVFFGLFEGWFESWYSYGVGDPFYFFMGAFISIVYFCFRVTRSCYV